MKSIILLALLVISTSAIADDYNSMHIAALACLTHAPKDWYGRPVADLDSPQGYEPGFGSCAALVRKWIDAANKRGDEEAAKRKAQEAEQAAAQKAQDIVTINQGLRAAGLPLIAE